MKSFFIFTLVGLLLFAFVENGHREDEGNDTLILTDSNFDQKLQIHKVLLVEFCNIYTIKILLKCILLLFRICDNSYLCEV